MWPELSAIQFLVVYLVFWIVIFVLLGLIFLIAEMHEMKRELKMVNLKRKKFLDGLMAISCLVHMFSSQKKMVI